MTQAEIEAAAAAIRLELDILLSDYSGDEVLIRDNESEAETDERRAVARARLDTMDWLRDLWSAKAVASEERLEGVAKAALEAAAKARG